MMLSVASHKTVNRMSVSAVAACMSPLLLRPLLAGECQLENTHMDVAGDGSLQLLQAAAAANHAQAIIILLLEEYKNIFGVNFKFPLIAAGGEHQLAFCSAFPSMLIAASIKASKTFFFPSYVRP